MLFVVALLLLLLFCWWWCFVVVGAVAFGWWLLFCCSCSWCCCGGCFRGWYRCCCCSRCRSLLASREVCVCLFQTMTNRSGCRRRRIYWYIIGCIYTPCMLRKLRRHARSTSEVDVVKSEATPWIFSSLGVLASSGMSSIHSS